MKQYSSAEMAIKTGRAARTVRKAAEAGGIGKKVGRDWVFTDADIAKINRAIGAPRLRPRRGSKPQPQPAPTQEPTP